MTSDSLQSAIASLSDPRESTRLQAARVLAGFGPALPTSAVETVREALARETVPWVRGALAEIIALSGHEHFVEGLVVPAPSWGDDLPNLGADEARQIINTSTKRLLHEVSSVVGRAKVAARGDLGSAYADSETARQLRFLSDVCSGLRTLSSATQAPDLEEFDLAQELEELAASVAGELICPIMANGHGPFIVVSDRGLLRVAVQNILVNAVEATLALGPVDESRAVTLTWGVSPDAFHATVIDRGVGPPSFLVSRGKAGVSTKEGHPGFGLATASEAMRSLGGSVEIRRNDRGGTTVVLSWQERR